MSEIKERLDNLRRLLLDRDFLEGRGLSNEVNIRVFCYKPEEEYAARAFVRRLLDDKNFGTRLVVFNLYELFLEICEDSDILEDVMEMEESDGSAALLEQLNTGIVADDFIRKMSEKIESDDYEAILLTGVGNVFPFMRVHKLLEAMQPRFSHVPILTFYPGEYDGTSLKLFAKLTPNSYYRAFNVL